MDKPVRSNLIGGIMLLILGSILLIVGISNQPDMNLHKGYVVLEDKAQLQEFSTKAMLNHIKPSDTRISGNDYPYLVRLRDVVLPPNADFPYGMISKAQIWNDPLAMGWGTFALSIGGVLCGGLGVIYLVVFTIWPQWATKRPTIDFKWVPFKKKEEVADDE